MPTMATFLSPIFEGMKDVDASLVPMLQQLEMAMLEGINFDLHIQLPLPALTGLQMDLLVRSRILASFGTDFGCPATPYLRQ